MAQTVSIKQSINVKHIQLKTKPDYLYLKRALIRKLFLNKTFLTEGSDRSWPRGL